MCEINVSDLANLFRISRQLIYYSPTQDDSDIHIKHLILNVWHNPKKKTYGHRRLAIELGFNKKRILRVMRKYKMKPFMRKRRFIKHNDIDKKPSKYVNLIKKMCPIRPDAIWVADFTYLECSGSFLYLATVIDLYTRTIVGWNVSNYHNTELVLGATTHAILNEYTTIPLFFHSDQGNKYDSRKHTDFVESLGIKVSMSAKASPWENPHQESFYSNFKLELGDISRFNTLGESIEEIAQVIDFHNQERIHTSLGMSPERYRKKQTAVWVVSDSLDSVSKKWGT